MLMTFILTDPEHRLGSPSHLAGSFAGTRTWVPTPSPRGTRAWQRPEPCPTSHSSFSAKQFKPLSRRSRVLREEHQLKAGW